MMPIVTIQIIREGTASEQRAAPIKGATDLRAHVLNKLPTLILVINQEAEMDHGVSGPEHFARILLVTSVDLTRNADSRIALGMSDGCRTAGGSVAGSNSLINLSGSAIVTFKVEA